MDISKLHEKLIAAGRATQPGDGVPYMFEQRIMHRLKGTKIDPWAVWEQSLVRGAMCSVILMLTLTAGSFFLPKPVQQTQSLSQDMEQTLFAAVDSSSGDSGVQ